MRGGAAIKAARVCD